MNKQEAFEFLELKTSATEAEIKIRLQEKQQYFEQLCATAPGEFLQKLHKRNIEKVQTIRNLFFPSGGGHDHSERKAAQVNASANSYAQPADHINLDQPVAWLICHTEHQSSRPHSLYAGENYFGRALADGKRSILLEHDIYVSRYHAVVEVQLGLYPKVFIQDAGAYTGKPSKNGIYINGSSQRIQNKVQLQENDTVQIGVTKLILRFNREKPINRIVEEVSKTEFIKTVVIDLF
ncbi:FHA domain-containing protein [Chitinophagaceae bacterium LB-8]|uniref:FHA domain-containing protein n=1 Tax=Paraflavisolibacter caeni TaxID=2982496 RepID=A0A9X3B9K3_9BACT|nr:FHA domain-containing protein [Paraflavisolibacter caeni]MCU7551421.1 FHA domain-containing protein [Paraflavisolibacter caeni]